MTTFNLAYNRTREAKAAHTENRGPAKPAQYDQRLPGGEQMLRIDLPRELENELTLLAALTGKSTQFHVRQAILEYLEDLDDRIVAEKWLEESLAAEDGRPDVRV